MKKRIITAAIAFSTVFSACGSPAVTSDIGSEAASEATTAETTAEETIETTAETTTETTIETTTETTTEAETEPIVKELKAGTDPSLDMLYSVDRSNAEKLYANSIALAYSFEGAQGLEPLSGTNTSDTFSARLWSYDGSYKEFDFTMLTKDSSLITDKGLILGTWVGLDDEGAQLIGGKPSIGGATVFHYGREITDYDGLRSSAADMLSESEGSDEAAEQYITEYIEPFKEYFIYRPVYVMPFYDDEGYACLHLSLDDDSTKYAQLRIAVSNDGYAALMSPDIGAFFPSQCSENEITDETFSSWAYAFLETDSVYYPLTNPINGNVRISDAAPDPECELTMDESAFAGSQCLLGSWVTGVSVY